MFKEVDYWFKEVGVILSYDFGIDVIIESVEGIISVLNDGDVFFVGIILRGSFEVF